MATSRKYHVSPFKPVTITPALGGKLMSDISADTVGLANYTVKRDFRRYLDREIRSEGYDYFWPNTSLPLGNQAFPNYPTTNQPITLIHQCRKPNGALAVVVGTPTTLYRYFALDGGGYGTGSGTSACYYTTDYCNDNPGTWITIGSGFSSSASRWQAVDGNGITVFNNGVDLPVTYDVYDTAVKPIYELRESGIAAVGNIAVSNGYLLCSDVQQISSGPLTSLLSLIPVAGVTASQTGAFVSNSNTAALSAGIIVSSVACFFGSSIGGTVYFANGQAALVTGYSSPTVVTTSLSGSIPATPFTFINAGNTDYTVVSSGAVFTSGMIGQQIVFASGPVRVIKQFVDSTHVVVDNYLPVTSGAFSFNNPVSYLAYTNNSNISRIQYRYINGMVFAPRRWGSSTPGVMVAGSNILVLSYPMLSLNEIVGQQITVLGAGLLGGNLTATLDYIAPDNMTCVLNARASTTVTAGLVQAFDATGANIGYTDLQDDGSAIVAMLDLKGSLVVYKETAIFVGSYSGTTGAPFNFSNNSVYRGEKNLYHENTLQLVTNDGVEFHVYAGQNDFYRFDLVYQEPVEIKVLTPCKNLFFDNVQPPQTTDPISCFAATNPLTKEVWFCVPESTSSDAVVRYDYFNEQVSTSSAVYTAAAGVKKPVAGIQVGVVEDWFIMGLSNGTVVRYGRTNNNPITSGSITGTQSGNTFTASSSIFTGDNCTGRSIQFPDLSVVNVAAYISATQVTVGGPSTTRAATVFAIIPAIWHRLGQAYDSTLTTGLGEFGYSSGEKTVEAFQVKQSKQSPNTPYTVSIYGGPNPNFAPSLLCSKTFSNPMLQNVVGMLFIQNYFQDSIVVSGINNPMEITEKVWMVSQVNSKMMVNR